MESQVIGKVGAFTWEMNGGIDGKGSWILMNLYFRVLSLLLRRFIFRRRIDLLGVSVLHSRVWPFDLDNNGHMNNGRYLALMDLGRLDIILTAGLFNFCRKWNCFPVVGASKVLYMKPLRPFQNFELNTRIAGWDSKWIYFDHQFESGNEVYAKGVVQSLFMGSSGKMPTAEILAAIQWTENSPKLPSDISEWLRLPGK